MEEKREPQQPAATPVIYPPAYSASPQTYYASPQPVKVGRWLQLRRALRLILIRLLRGLVVIGRALRPYAVFVVIIVALLGVLGWMSYLLWWPKESAPAFQREESLPPAAAVESYIEGQKNYNADLMWDAYSTAFQSSLLQNGASKDLLRDEANKFRTGGVKFLRYKYIGGVDDDGGSMYFYSVNVSVPSQNGQTRNLQLPLIFRADADGKITGIDSPLTNTGN